MLRGSIVGRPPYIARRIKTEDSPISVRGGSLGVQAEHFRNILASGLFAWVVVEEEVMQHELKTLPDPFEATRQGIKKFEFRKNDRKFRVHDVLLLREWDPTSEQYTKRELYTRISYILRGPEFVVPEGYVIMSMVSLLGDW